MAGSISIVTSAPLLNMLIVKVNTGAMSIMVGAIEERVALAVLSARHKFTE